MRKWEKDWKILKSWERILKDWETVGFLLNMFADKMGEMYSNIWDQLDFQGSKLGWIWGELTEKRIGRSRAKMWWLKPSWDVKQNCGNVWTLQWGCWCMKTSHHNGANFAKKKLAMHPRVLQTHSIPQAFDGRASGLLTWIFSSPNNGICI